MEKFITCNFMKYCATKFDCRGETQYYGMDFSFLTSKGEGNETGSLHVGLFDRVVLWRKNKKK